MLIRLVPISVVLVSGVGITTWTHHLLSEHRDLVVHTHEVIETTKDVLIALDDAETGQRGYLLGGERQYLEPYTHARERLGMIAASLKQQLADNTDQTARLDLLSPLIQKKLDELRAAIAARDTSGPAVAIGMVLSSNDQATMDAIRREIGQITEGEKALLSARDVIVQADERRAQLVAVLIGLASILTRVAVEFILTAQANRLTSKEDRILRGSSTPGSTVQADAGSDRA